TADSNPYLRSVVDSVAVSGFDIVAMSLTSTLSGNTEAYVDENADVRASSLTVAATMRRLHDDSVISDLLYVGVGLLGAGGHATATATIDANTRAFVGARGTP